jgi:hypothetical protein
MLPVIQRTLLCVSLIIFVAFGRTSAMKVVVPEDNAPVVVPATATVEEAPRAETTAAATEENVAVTVEDIAAHNVEKDR